MLRGRLSGVRFNNKFQSGKDYYGTFSAFLQSLQNQTLADGAARAETDLLF